MALTVISTLELDMAHPGVNIVHAKQYDNSGRVVRIHLMKDGEPWVVPSDTFPVVRYRKTDRMGGFYDTDENHVSAINYPYREDHSYIDVTIALQALTTAATLSSPVHMEVNFYDPDAIRVSTFSWSVMVEQSVLSDDEVVSSEYYNALSTTIGTIVRNYDNAEEYALRSEAAMHSAETYASQAVTDVPTFVSDWLTSHISNPTSPPVDETLTIDGPGVAAGSKITGNQIMHAIGNQITEPIQMTQNRYIDLSGLSCDITQLVPSDYYECAAILCEPGDRFLITACGRKTAKPWGFVASDKRVLNTASANSATDTTFVVNEGIIAPSDAVYLVINNRKSERVSISYKGSKTSYSLAISDGCMELPNNTDLNDIIFPGNYYVANNNNTYANLPLFGGAIQNGKITVVSLNLGGSIKQIYETAAGFRQAYRTSYVVSGTRIWTEWFFDSPADRSYQLSVFYGTKITQNSDLNDVRTIGTYYVATLADALTITNAPSFNGKHYAGKMIVEQAIDSTKLLQTYITYENGYVARRTYNGNTWSDWVTDYTITNERMSLVEELLDNNEGQYTFTPGFIALKNNNKNADLTSVSYDNTYETMHAIIECKDGDVFSIVTTMPGRVGEGWFFVDDSSDSANASVLQYDVANTYANGIAKLIAPKNSTKLVINSVSDNCILSKKGSGYHDDLFHVSSESISIERLIKTSGTDVFGYINTTTSPVSFTRIAPNASYYKSQIIPCKSGDIFKINTIGGIAPRAWAFLDSSNKSILMAKPNEVCRNTIVVAPENAVNLVINMCYSVDRSGSSPVSVNGLGYHSYKCVTKPVVDVQNQLETGLKLIEFEDGGINVSGAVGDTVNLTREHPHPTYTVYIRSAVIDCKENDVFTLNTYSTDTYKNTYSTYCFVSADNKIISKSNATTQAGIIYAPENAAKLILNDVRSEVVITNNLFPIENFSYVGKLVNSGKLNDTSVTIYDYKILNPSGDVTDNSIWYTTDFISVQNLYNRIVYVNTKFVINEYTKANKESFIKRTTVQYPSPFVLDANTKYIRVSAHYYTPSNDLSITAIENDQLYSILHNIRNLYERPKSFSLSILEAKMKHFRNVKWTPKAPMPVILKNHKYVVAQPGTEYIGLPYSSMRGIRKYIGCDITLYTFLSALQNPKSVLYTRIVTDGFLGATYYGTVCTTYPAYAIGYYGEEYYNFGPYVQCTSFTTDPHNPRRDEFEDVQMNDVQPGDLLVIYTDYESSGKVENHVRMVMDVIQDPFGRIDAVRLEEGAAPLVGQDTYVAFSDFKNILETTDYKLYRYKSIGLNTYKASPFVKGYPDDILEDYVYPDIMTEYGDKVCITAGEDVTINIIDAKSYNIIRIYKDDNPWREISSIEDFVLRNVAYGKYRIVITDGTHTSECSFISADVNASYDTNTNMLSFSSVNAIPIVAQSYGTQATYPSVPGVANRTYYINNTDRHNGIVDLSDKNLFGPHCPFVSVTFATEYGTAVWWQEPVDQQWTEWSYENKDNIPNRTYVSDDLSKYNNQIDE